MKGSAIIRTTQVIRDRLSAALSRQGFSSNVFVGPLDDDDAETAQLILFLYRIAPTASLRNAEHRVPSSTQGAQVDVFLNSLPLDLHYLLTVGKLPNSSEELPLHWLGLAIQELQSNPVFNEPGIEHESIRVSLEPLSTEELSRIWALFPAANYRTSVAYVASPIWIDPDTPPVLASPVTSDQLAAGSKITRAVT